MNGSSLTRGWKSRRQTPAFSRLALMGTGVMQGVCPLPISPQPITIESYSTARGLSRVLLKNTWTTPSPSPYFMHCRSRWTSFLMSSGNTAPCDLADVRNGAYQEICERSWYRARGVSLASTSEQFQRRSPWIRRASPATRPTRSARFIGPGRPMCVLCGRREPWVSPWPDSSIGPCELCFRVVFGRACAEAVAAELARRSK